MMISLDVIYVQLGAITRNSWWNPIPVPVPSTIGVLGPTQYYWGPRPQYPILPNAQYFPVANNISENLENVERYLNVFRSPAVPLCHRGHHMVLTLPAKISYLLKWNLGKKNQRYYLITLCHRYWVLGYWVGPQ